MPIARTPSGHRIHYDVYESASATDRPPVVLIQGLCLSSIFWFDTPERLANDPVRAHRVITLDNRGTGNSDRPRGAYRMRDMADDVVAVLDALSVPKATIVGISLGGMIAQNVALRHPDRVHGLVLLATTPGLPHGRPPGPSAIMALLTLPFARNRASRALVRLLLPKSEHGRAAAHFRHWPRAFRQHPTTFGTFFSQLAAAATHSTGFDLPKIDCPTVVVTGADDILIPPANSTAIAKRLRRVELEILPDVAHAIPVLDEQVVERALLKLEALADAPERILARERMRLAHAGRGDRALAFAAACARQLKGSFGRLRLPDILASGAGSRRIERQVQSGLL